MRKVCIIGWDGGTFDLVRPWVEEGKLPNLARLMAEGVHGPLQSTIPPWSFQAWSSFMTGKNPGKHGIFDFFRTPPGTYDLQFVNADQRRGGETFWQVLSRSGRRVISISIPGTFPPDPVNGVMLSGFDFPGEGPGSFLDESGIHPKSMFRELLESVGPFPIDPPILKPMEQGRYDLVLEKVVDTIKAQARTAEYLMTHQPWDCFMMVFGESDGASHYFWQFCDPDSPFFTRNPPNLEDSILRVYQELDRQTGRLLELVPKDATVVVMSDHGSGGISDWILFPNLWLQEKGFIRLKGLAASRFSRLRERFKQWGIATLPSILQRQLYRKAIRTLGRYEARLRYGIIDWSQTEAYFDENPYYPVIRVNLKGMRPHGIVEAGEHYEDVRDRLIEELEAWRHPETGTPVVEKAYRREEVYWGESSHEAADVIPKWAMHQRYNFGFRVSSMSPDGRWITRLDPHKSDLPFYPRKFSSHRDQAMLVISGPDVPSGSTLEGARIIDLAPTILKWLEVPIPDDMDGCVLEFSRLETGDQIERALGACHAQ